MRLNNVHVKNLLLVALAGIVPTLLIWTPFFLKLPSFWNIKLPQEGMATVIANFDGPYYIVTAKTLYNPSEIEKFPFAIPSEYYAAHFPGFPLLIRVLSPLTGYPWAMMAVTLISSITALSFFYLLLVQTGLARHALWLTLVFSIFPARWLVVRSVGSPEPLFIAAILAAFYFFTRGNFWVAALAGAIAQFTKSPGILLFAALAASIIIPQIQDIILRPLVGLRKIIPKLLPFILIPLSALAVFLIYTKTYNDFFAYFHSGDNIHLMFPPFQIFNTVQTWVGTFWLEEIIWLYLFGFLGIFQLVKKKKIELAAFVTIFFVSTLFVSHRDVSRYMLPVVPFLFISFSEILTSTPFKWAMAFLVIPIYLFSINFIVGNVTPILDWSPLL